MRQINPWAAAWSNAVKTDRKREVAMAIRKKYFKQRTDYMNSMHLFERTFSDNGVGEFRVMSGRDVSDLNDRLLHEFIKAIDKKIVGRSLERWVLAEPFVHGKPNTKVAKVNN